MRRADTLIVGGGPAGSAAAILLARAGRRPLLFERNRAPTPLVCGGFLGGDALNALDRLGIDPIGLGARPIRRLRLVVGRRQVELDLPFAACGLSRQTLDAALLEAAERGGAMVERGVPVRGIEGGAVRIAAGWVAAEAILLATGKHELRGLPRAMPDDPALGLRFDLCPGAALTAALEGVVELILFAQGWAGLLVQDDGRINLCLSIAESRLAAAGSPRRLIAELAQEVPRLAERLGQARSWGEMQAAARLPYGWIAPPDPAPCAPFRLGDQAAVIPSLVGDGVAIALASGQQAAACLLAGKRAAVYQAALAARARRPVLIASILRAIAENPPLSRAALPLLAQLPGLVRSLCLATRIEGY